MEKELKYATEFNPQIVRDNEEILASVGYDEYYRMRIAMDRNTQDPLARAKLWMIDNVFKNRKYGKVIDVGCGMGEDCHRFHSLGYDVTGIDKDRTKMEFCWKLEKHYNHDMMRFALSRLLEFQALDKEFDVAYSCMVLEHFRSPADAFMKMCQISKFVCGIVHMGKQTEDNPYHTRFLNIASVKHLLDAYLCDEYAFEVLDEHVFAMFYGVPRPIIDYISNDGLATKLIEIGVQGQWRKKFREIRDVEVKKIISTFQPTNEFQETVVNDYISCLEMFGKRGIEENTFAISFVHIPDTDTYRVLDDGNHRICALKRYGKIDVIRASVIELEHDDRRTV